MKLHCFFSYVYRASIDIMIIIIIIIILCIVTWYLDPKYSDPPCRPWKLTLLTIYIQNPASDPSESLL